MRSERRLARVLREGLLECRGFFRFTWMSLFYRMVQTPKAERLGLASPVSFATHLVRQAIPIIAAPTPVPPYSLSLQHRRAGLLLARLVKHPSTSGTSGNVEARATNIHFRTRCMYTLMCIYICRNTMYSSDSICRHSRVSREPPLKTNTQSDGHFHAFSPSPFAGHQ